MQYWIWKSHVNLDFELFSKFNGLRSLFQNERYSLPFHFLNVSLTFYCLWGIIQDEKEVWNCVLLQCVPSRDFHSSFILLKDVSDTWAESFFRQKKTQHVWATEARFMIELWQWPSNKKTSQFTFSKIPMVCVSQPTTFFYM